MKVVKNTRGIMVRFLIRLGILISLGRALQGG